MVKFVFKILVGGLLFLIASDVPAVALDTIRITYSSVS